MPRMLVTDLDGTLLDSRGRLGARDRRTLERLGEQRVLRVVATGRSLHSARRVMDDAFPVDYLVFASGAGISCWPDGELLAASGMTREEAVRASTLLMELGFDFMLHHAVPDNHRFHYWRRSRENPDFERRCAAYRDHAGPWREGCAADTEASQLLVVEPAGTPTRHGLLCERLHPLNVVRTTSPLDGVSTWLEIFPAGVSKSQGAAWLARRHGIARERSVAIGNDYNDLDLLAWAGAAFVVANAAPALRARHPTVASNDEQGVSEAVQRWLRGPRWPVTSTPERARNEESRT